MTDAMLILLASGVGTATSMVVGLYKDARNRKWDIQDRKEKAEALREESLQIARYIEMKVEVAAEKVERESAQIRTDIVENTKVSQEAKTASTENAVLLTEIKADVVDLKTNGITKKEP